MSPIDPDDVSRWPVGPLCQVCGADSDLVVTTADVLVGIACVALCRGCADIGRLPRISPGAAVRAVIAHATHLGCCIDDLVISNIEDSAAPRDA
jgi:hypothetical protein